MKIEIATDNVDDDHMVRKFIQRKVQFALDRTGYRIPRVVVRLKGVTRYSDVVDVLCQIEGTLDPSGEFHVSAHGESVFDAVLQATRNIRDAIKRDDDPQRQSLRGQQHSANKTMHSSLDDKSESEDDVATIGIDEST